MNDGNDILGFGSRVEFRTWLERNHAQGAGIWILFTKGNPLFTAKDALEESICFGWIDGVMKSVDETQYRKYFSKRKDLAKWSEKNKSLFQELLARGLMTEWGIAVFRPEQNGSAAAGVTDRVAILRKALEDKADILELFDATSASRQKQMAGFFCDAKTETTRNKRKDKIVGALRDNYKGMLY